jgi:hypothetical protein
MADIIYTVNQDSPENIIGFEQYSQEDRALVDSFQINNTFNPTRDFSELHILSLSDELLESIYDYRGYKQAPAAQSAGQDGTSAITIDPIEDSKTYGYGEGGVKLLYHFLNDLYSQDRSKVDFYIQDISADRTEISLSTLVLPTEEVLALTSTIKTKLQSQSYFAGFRLNFQENDLFIAINIDTLDSPTGTVVVVKLYEPLPDTYGIKSTLNIVEVVSDSVAYEVETEIITPPTVAPTLRSPNFNIDIVDDSVIPTNYYNYDELLSYPVNNSNSQIYSTVNEKSIDISIDHSDFSDFIHFSSAQERLLNFKYKLDLITNYSASLAERSAATTGLQGVSGSNKYYEGLITGIVSNFDHYERFLYYESGSNSWPKVNGTKPYINEQSYVPGTLTPNPAVTTWYSNKIANAISYDNTNYNSLAYSIPTYLRDDVNNENYLTFIYMIGQHFDNLWLYSKAVTDKYDADNRLDKGISKDLVAEALKNFGVKLYTSNKSIEDLFSTFIGQAYQSGSEDINFYITGSLTGSNTPIQPSSIDNYQKEVYKRIYHNLPLLLKSKGTERGLRALINCFGIPSDIFDIKLYGGRNVNERPFYGDYRYSTSSLNKIRLDNTGSITSGSTLSQYTSIIKRDSKYTDDLHSIELGFSPTDNVDNYIISKSLSTGLSSFNIDDYIGDPRNLYLDNYYTLTPTGSISGTLEALTNQLMSGSDAYNVQDFVRLIKFFDNTIFKMVRDFIPARSVADTGIIIKPHLLQRNKAKSPFLSGSRPEHSGSIDTAFIESSDGNTFGAIDTYTTAYADIIQTPIGLASAPFLHNQEQPKYNGEFNGSNIGTTNGELNEDNPYKDLSIGGYNFGEVLYVSSSNQICLLSNKQNSPLIITSSTFELTADYLFNFTRQATVYSTSSTVNITGSGTPGNPYSATTFPFNLSGYGNYDQFYISASSVDINPQPCSSSILVRFATCSLGVSVAGSIVSSVKQGLLLNPPITSWFNIHPLQTQAQYTASWSDGTTNFSESISNPASYIFTQDEGTNVTITVVDPYSSNCRTSVTVVVGQCSYTTISTGSYSRGLEFEFSNYRRTTRAFLDSGQLNDTGEISGTTLTQETTLNGTLFNVYGVPVDANVVFSPSYLQLPRTTPTTQYGTPPVGFTVQSGRDRGLQSYFSPYCPIPGQGLQIPPDISFNVYKIMNDPGDVLTQVGLGDNTKYLHTVSNPSGSDTYIAYLEYANISLSDILSTQGTSLSTAVGGGLNLPTDIPTQDIAGPSSTFPWLNPVLYVTPPQQILTTPVEGYDGLVQYPVKPNDPTRIRELYPVAYYIEGVTTDGLTCTAATTVYPNFFTFRALTPSITNPSSAYTDAAEFIFVDKTVPVGISQAAWGTPIGNVTSITVPIRKRV